MTSGGVASEALVDFLRNDKQGRGKRDIASRTTLINKDFFCKKISPLRYAVI